MACSCGAADHVRDMLHEGEWKWLEEEDDEKEEDEASDAAQEGDARVRLKERLQCKARNEVTPPPPPPPAARSTERSESAFRARR